MKTCPLCQEEEIEEEEDTCFICAYEYMDDIERENLNSWHEDE